MERDKILITKEMIPYTFDILLGDELFNLTVNYNKAHDFFTVSLAKDGVTICEGEPVIYGFPLFHDLYQPNLYPGIDIVPLDESGEHDTVTFTTLNETVFLIVKNYDESGDAVE